MLTKAILTRFFSSFVSTVVTSLMVFFAAWSNTAHAEAIGAPAFAGDNLISDKRDLYVLLGNGVNADSLYREYRFLEKKYENASPQDICSDAAKLFSNRADIPKGIMLLKVAASKYDKNATADDQATYIEANSNIGYYLIFERNNPLEAYPYLVNAIEIYKEMPLAEPGWLRTAQINAITAVYTNIAKIFSIFKDDQRASHYYQEAFKVAYTDNNPLALPLAFIDLLNYAWTSGHLASINEEIRQYLAVNLPKHHMQRMDEYARLMAEGASLYLQKDFDGALAKAESALLTIDNELDDRRTYVMNRFIAGIIAMQQKDFKRASIPFNEAEETILKEGLTDMYDLMYLTKSDYCSKVGRQDMAEKYRYEGLRMKDSLQNLQTYSLIRDIELSSMSNDFTRQISDSHKEKLHWMHTALTTVVLLAMILCLAVYIIIKNRQLKKRGEMLFRKNLELMEAKKSMAKEAEVSYGPNQAEEEGNAGDTYDGGPETGAEDMKPKEDEESRRKVLDRVLAFMQTSPDIYKVDFTIETLADALDLRVKEASRAINAEGKNFNTFLAEYRIKKACERLLETSGDISRRPTMAALAEEVGYKSRTYFSSVFKSIVGLTPSEFVNEANKNASKPPQGIIDPES